MTNFEKLKALNARDFWNKIKSLQNGLSSYIDYISWLNSEDEDLRHFMKTTRTVTVYPSESAVQGFINERRAAGQTYSDADIEHFKETHKEDYCVLGYETIYSQSYVCVADLSAMTIKKVPAKECVSRNKAGAV